jgi:serine/threonine protein kinase
MSETIDAPDQAQRPAAAHQPDDYSAYGSGLSRLLDRIEQDHPRYSDVLVYQQRLTENVWRSQLYGDTVTQKAERAEIIHHLNLLSVPVLGTTFNELCGLGTPTTVAAPSERLLGRYLIVEELGRGVISVVYRAFEPALDRFVALKLLWPQLSDDAEFVDRFRSQAKTLARLSHRHIVTVYDVGEADRQFYIAMECLSGRNLAHVLAAEGALPFDRAFLILGQAADALDYAHRHGVLHQNIKPSNIIVDEQTDETLRVALTDFGLMKDWSLVDTSTTRICGTPEYMSPEVIEQRGICAATDLYALSAVAYQMLTGRVPYAGDNIVTILYSHVNAPPPAASALRPGLPSDVDAVFRKALAKDPADRYDTGVEFVSALKAAVA